MKWKIILFEINLSLIVLELEQYNKQLISICSCIGIRIFLNNLRKLAAMFYRVIPIESNICVKNVLKRSIGLFYNKTFYNLLSQTQFRFGMQLKTSIHC